VSESTATEDPVGDSEGRGCCAGSGSFVFTNFDEGGVLGLVCCGNEGVCGRGEDAREDGFAAIPLRSCCDLAARRLSLPRTDRGLRTVVARLDGRDVEDTFVELALCKGLNAREFGLLAQPADRGRPAEIETLRKKRIQAENENYLQLRPSSFQLQQSLICFPCLS
jgi:hypothetical protein